MMEPEKHTSLSSFAREKAEFLWEQGPSRPHRISRPPIVPAVSFSTSFLPSSASGTGRAPSS
jgi:hypothetical protein